MPGDQDEECQGVAEPVPFGLLLRVVTEIVRPLGIVRVGRRRVWHRLDDIVVGVSVEKNRWRPEAGVTGFAHVRESLLVDGWTLDTPFLIPYAAWSNYPYVVQLSDQRSCSGVAEASLRSRLTGWVRRELDPMTTAGVVRHLRKQAEAGSGDVGMHLLRWAAQRGRHEEAGIGAVAALRLWEPYMARNPENMWTEIVELHDRFGGFDLPAAPPGPSRPR